MHKFILILLVFTSTLSKGQFNDSISVVRFPNSEVMNLVYPKIGLNSFSSGKYAAELGLQYKHLTISRTCVGPIETFIGGFTSTSLPNDKPYSFNLNSGLEVNVMTLGIGVQYHYQKDLNLGVNSLGPSFHWWLVYGEVSYNYNFRLNNFDSNYTRHRLSILIDTWMLFKRKKKN